MTERSEDERIARNKTRCRQRRQCTIFVLSIYVVSFIYHMQPNFKDAPVSQAPEHLRPTHFTADDLKEDTKTAIHQAKMSKDSSPSDAFAENPIIELTVGHFRQVGSSFARPFPVKNLSDLCVSERNERRKGKNASHPFIYANDPRGAFYVKVPKAASSTLAGINYRIARRHGERALGYDCVHNEKHLDSVGRYYGNRDVARSFLWGSVRDPTSRAISRIFYFHISEREIEPTDKNIMALLRSNNFQWGSISDGQGGFQLRYMTVKDIPAGSFWSGKQKTVVLQPEVLLERVQDVILDYDFIAVTERMDESLVALQLLMGLRMGDILSTSSKVAGTFSMAHRNMAVHEAPCIEIQKSFISEQVKEYVESDQWYAKNYGDYLLYAAANRSLDLTIKRLGRDRFEGALRKYRQAKALVDERCESKASPPCSVNGTNQYALSEQDCYSFDEGCGYPCVDALLRDEPWLEAE